MVKVRMKVKVGMAEEAVKREIETDSEIEYGDG